ncbi:MAG: hypothetical protein HYY09_02445 [Firmicutes bacterium]|nr:hypothetical protein [Bacillota bacterium]
MTGEAAGMTKLTAVGLAGTAKNTGKTTATAAIIREGSRYALLGVTSIGYDGETVDNVTRLPKPRLPVPEGTLVATARTCLGAGSARLEILEDTTLPTPLGTVAVARVVEAGTVLLAGPNNTGDLQACLQALRAEGAELTLVDGALNRLAPMAATGGIVLCTGAARVADAEILAREAAGYDFLFNLPSASREIAADLQPVEGAGELHSAEAGTILLLGRGGQTQALPFGSLLVHSKSAQVLCAAERAAAGQDGLRGIFIPGALGETALGELLSGLSRIGAPEVLAEDVTKLLVGGKPDGLARLISEYRERGGRFGLRRRIPLLAVTVCPFYPLYRKTQGDYQPAYLDAGLLWREVAAAVQVPVVDVVRQGAGELIGAMKGAGRVRAGECQS